MMRPSGVARSSGPTSLHTGHPFTTAIALLTSTLQKPTGHASNLSAAAPKGGRIFGIVGA